jgi:integrative and conjugative element protein (TIGR02256 family)
MTAPIYLCRTAFDAICAEAGASGDLETGGVLVGYESREGEVVLTRATGPGPGARRSGVHIELDHGYVCTEVATANVEGLQYQGSWHKHPTTNHSAPSGVDRLLLRSAANSWRYELHTAVLIVTIKTPTKTEDLRAFICRKWRWRIAIAPIILCRDPV